MASESRSWLTGQVPRWPETWLRGKLSAIWSELYGYMHSGGTYPPSIHPPPLGRVVVPLLVSLLIRCWSAHIEGPKAHQVALIETARQLAVWSATHGNACHRCLAGDYARGSCDSLLTSIRPKPEIRDMGRWGRSIAFAMPQFIFNVAVVGPKTIQQDKGTWTPNARVAPGLSG
jgi:hypothetical protein